ncbi:MAG TPA: hypothetical protein PK079_21570, partial [Leptospiraceae bacterium]|nr:hypothetical protein [Leptospiraceae bacterium]HMW08408.1 hypothetical protein [Leptospiraceae bacterium]HMX33690.1 hypothetical protein [Leptospiraceae bacterium]HMY34095.1 hypothetical protein [Leptospiraceae bacterium]HMZ65959.1 hypothetical protein [Leptospiraceae bacterium]
RTLCFLPLIFYFITLIGYRFSNGSINKRVWAAVQKRINHEEHREHEEKRRFIIYSLRESSCASWLKIRKLTALADRLPFSHLTRS